MKSRLPATPMESLSLSGVVAFIVKIVHFSARLFGFWRTPSKKAAADFEDMTLLDKIYWGYKSKNPVVHGEMETDQSIFYRDHDKTFALPEGFETKNSVTFAAVGDLIKVDGLEHSKDTLYSEVADMIFDKDITYGNLESQLTGQDVSTYTFSDKETPPLCCTTEQYDALKEHKGKRLDLMHTACNHTFDVGLEGVETTLAQLQEDGITDLGTNRTPEERGQAKIIRKNGIAIGFAAATLGLNGKEVPEGKEYMVNVVKFHRTGAVDLSLIESQIAYCKEQGCDIIVASLHWGYEYEFCPRQHQIELAHEIVEMGADVIIGHHSHTLQPMEFYRTRRDPDRAAVIAYSLGNLTSSFSAPHIVLNGILILTLVKGKVKGQTKTLVQEARMIPVLQRELDKGLQIETLEAAVARKDKSAEERVYIAEVARYSSIAGFPVN